ncbi:MAG: M20/M25/M40 family metallo-hydrolase, partial [Pseudomonadota bacterium]
MTDLSDVRRALDPLIAFDTTSRGSNLELIDWVEELLTPLGANLTRIPNEDGTKSNLWARIGPDAPGGIVLSGHTDVVPIDGQPWDADPWRVREADGKLYGRGTCDMKSFVALCLAFAPAFAAAKLTRPIHFAFSYDEEVGCLGAPSMIDAIIAAGAAPSAVWVGEPTEWKVVTGHKGIMVHTVEIIGLEAHSSLPHHGVSAVHEAIDLMGVLRDI